MERYTNKKAAKQSLELRLGYSIAVDILESVPRISGWPFYRQRITRTDIHALLGNNKTKMLQAFGTQDFTYLNDYRYWIWFFTYNDLVFAVSCSLRGTELLFFQNLSTAPYSKRKAYNFVKTLADYLQ